VPVAALPSARGDGAPVTRFIELAAGSRVVAMMAGAADSRWLLGTRGGLGFMCTLGDMVSRQKAGRQFLNLDEGDQPLRPVPVPADAVQVAVLGKSGRLLVFGFDEIKVLSAGGRGTQLMQLEAGDQIDQWLAIGPAGLKVSGIWRQKPMQEVLAGAALTPWVNKRARKGKPFTARPKPPVLSPA
jgi:topoisomerase-4 subunit A